MHRTKRYVRKEVCRNVAGALPCELGRRRHARRRLVKGSFAPVWKVLSENNHQRPLAWDGRAAGTAIVISQPVICRAKLRRRLTDNAEAIVLEIGNGRCVCHAS